MARITYIENDGTEHSLDVGVGLTLMEGAVRSGVPGIDADCGGGCACATCHVYVDARWRDEVGEPAPDEQDMLDFADDVRSSSRLACQISVVPNLDGLVVRLPARQR